MKKLTIEELLQSKKITQKPKMYFDSEVLDRRIDFEKIDPSKIMEALFDAKDGNMSVHNTNLYIIYLSVPMFRNQQMLEKYGIKDSPYKIVEEIFENNVMEITNFADTILSIYGFDAKKIEKLKK
ncbi:putative uncharacterized protein [Clostridium sp. CAG:768]|nr:putative uncharacterized protein [Clostridium sp. CAG:768]